MKIFKLVSRVLVFTMLVSVVGVFIPQTTNVVQAAEGTVTTYPGPTGITASDQYSVKVNGQDSFVYKSNTQRTDGSGGNSVSFTDFAFSGGTVTVEVTKLTAGEINSVTIRPLNLGIVAEVSENTVTFTVTDACKVSVEINDDLTDKLFIFADPPEVDVPSPTDPDVIYFGPGVYDIGKNYTIPTGKTLYLAGGAYVKGSIYSLGQDNITVRGRGILSGENYPHVDGPANFIFKDCKNVTMDGIISLYSPGYNVTNGYSSDPGASTLNTFTNLKMIGWQDNTDGIHTQYRSVIDGLFFFGHDDAIDIGQFVTNLKVTNCTTWNLWGSALLFSWISGFGSNVFVDNINAIHSAPNSSVFLMVHGGSGNLNNYTIQNVRAETMGGENNSFINVFMSKSSWSDPNAPWGSLSNLYFKNIQIDYPSYNNFIKGYDVEHPISNIIFENLKINGKVVNSLTEARINTNDFTKNITFIDKNYINNWSFEADGATISPSGWNITGDTIASYTDLGPAALGDVYGEHKASQPYQVYTSQNISLPNGTYTLSARVKSSGGQNSAVMKAENFGGTAITKDIPVTSSWTKIKIDNIQVTNGQCTIGFYSDANAGNSINFDNVMLGNQHEYKLDTNKSLYQAKAGMGTPLIDGTIDTVWNKTPSFKASNLRLGSKVTTGTYRMLWDTDNLYVLAQVVSDARLNSDATDIWNRDAVEFYIDEGNEKKSDGLDSNDRHIIVDYTNQQANFDIVGLNGVTSATSYNSSSYIVEIRIPLTEVHTIGDVIGFDGQVNYTGNETSRASITGWAGSDNTADQKASGWGEVTLWGYQADAVMGTPDMDAINLSDWEDAPVIQADQLRLGSIAPNATYKAMWDSKNLYLLAQVVGTSELNSTSSNIWENDSVEIFMNEDGSKSDTLGPDDRHIIVNYENRIQNFDSIGLQGVKSITSINGNSYMVMIQIPFSMAHNGGDLLGFDGQVNNTGNSENRISITGWSGSQNQSDQKNSVWGSLRLVGYEATATRGTPNMSEDTLDPIWDSVPEINVGQLRGGTIPMIGTYKVMWDNKYLYVLAKADSTTTLNNNNLNIWEKDSVEFFVDEGNKVTGPRHIIVSYVNDIANFDAVGLAGVVSYAKTIDEKSFYAIIKIPFSYSHVIGDRIGFDGQLDCTLGSGIRKSITGWAGNKESSWGTLILADAPASSSPISSATLSADTMILNVGDSTSDKAALMLTGILQDGSMANNIANADITYTVSDQEVLKIDDISGIATALKTGIVDITATVTLNGATVTTNSITIVIYNPFVVNPSFEDDGENTSTPSGWITSGFSAQIADAHTGSYKLTCWNSQAYTARGYQDVTSLPNGYYTASVWVRSGGGQNSASFYVENYGGPKETLNVLTSVPGNQVWHQVKITNIKITNGQCRIGVVVDANGFNWMNLDDFKLIRTGDIPPGALMSASLIASKTVLDINESVQLSVEGIMGDGSPADLSLATIAYSSNSPTVISVDDSGKVTSLKVGSADIVAEVTLNGVKVSSNIITITSSSVNYIINPGFEAIPKGTGWELGENCGVKTDGGYNSNSYVTTWSGNEYSTTVSQTITGLPDGVYSANAWVRYGDINTASVTAKDFGGQANKICVIKESNDPDNGAYHNISIPFILVTNGQCIVEFSVDGKANGWFNIDEVQFVSAGELTDIILGVSKTSLMQNSTAQLLLSGTMSNNSTVDFSVTDVVYSSSNPEVVSVDNNGTVTALKVGSAEVWADVTLAGVTVSSNRVAIHSTPLNYVINPGIEADSTGTGWILGPNSYPKTDGGHNSNNYITTWAGSPYDTTVSQTISGLPNGMYTASAWVRYGDINTASFSAKDFGGQEDAICVVKSVYDQDNAAYNQVNIPLILVANNQCKLEFAISSKAGGWFNIDDVQLISVPVLEEVVLSISQSALNISNSAQLNLIATMSDGVPAELSNASVIYTSSSPDIVEVNDQGVITAISRGSADIIASVTLDGVEVVSNIVTISVSGPTEPSYTPPAEYSSSEQKNNLIKDGKILTVKPIVDSATGEAKADPIKEEEYEKALETAATDKNGVKTVLVEIPKADGAKAYISELPKSAIASGKTGQNVKVSTELGSITAPGNMLSSSFVAGAKSVELVIGVVDKETLDASIQTQIGNRPVIEVNVRIDGKNLSWSNADAPVRISIPYEASATELADPEHIVVWYIDNEGKASAIPSGRYDAAAKTVTFTTTHFSMYAVAFDHKTFEDIANYTWAKEQIEILASKGITSGTSQTTFSPSANITRADFLIMLQKALSLEAIVESNFTDVTPDKYYYTAVGIAKKLGLVNGTGDNKFNPTTQITRQDMMVIIDKALRLTKKLSVIGTATDLDKFSDAQEVSKYAVAAVSALSKEGIVNGSNNKINPLGSATRAEVAVVIYKIYNLK